MNDVHAIRGGRRLLLLLCSLTLGACAMGPDYVRPPVATPAHYGEPHAAPAATAAAAAPWWSRYDDPVLAALVARVTVDNQSLKAAAARVAEARALARAARGQLKPSAAIGTFNVGTGNRRDFGVGIGWEIDLWGKLRRNVEAHGASATASADDLAAATLSLQATLVKAYFALREKDAAIALLQPAVATDTRALTVVRNQQQQGVASLADVTRAHTRLAASRTQLSADALARAQLQHAIAVLLGVPPAEFELAPAPFTASVPAIPAGLPSELLERRPDIAAAERRMAAASAMIGVRKAEAMPSLNLVAGVGALHGLFATPSVKAPLYEGGALRANVAHARAEYDEAVANYRQTVLDAFREVEDNLAAQRILAQAVAPRAAAADAAGQLARAVNNQFQAGVASAAALADAETDALDNARGNLDLRLQRLDASADLVVALGGGWQNPDARAPAATATAAPAARDEPRP